MVKSVAVLGLGLFGSAVARGLAEDGVSVIAVDENMDHVEGVMDAVDNAVQADFTKLDQLKETGVGSVDIGIVATGEKLEITILGIMNLKKLGVEHVIVKTKNANYKEVLLKVGASRVVLPEVEMGRRLANELASANVLEAFKLDDRYHLVEICVLDKWVGHRINELHFRKKYDFNIIAIKSQGLPTFDAQIDPTYVIQDKDLFLVLSENKNLNENLHF
ncbi:potassium transporter [Erysipelothrix larvae]|uniref:Potassium transporter n=1 Tax=Erysipelothrix larvae TaxID=1514105 RepID=A0A120JTE4_9FIRM|nr:TrkA family potassium uptake protein [Erysipelothrix larvae]AMC92580.1 potassium transporter [Erysipelothrix larvae]